LLPRHAAAQESRCRPAVGEAAPARQYLLDRSSTLRPQHFWLRLCAVGLGYADKHLLRKGLSSKLEAAGCRGGRHGPMDRFHRRLLWPIHASGSEVIGFGARRIFDDDTMEAKYINTPETVPTRSRRSCWP
jgi:DNA primase